jgi:hypothetical protein
MENFGCNGPEQQPPERAVSMRGHHDQIDMFRFGEVRNRSGWVAFSQDVPYFETAQFTAPKVLHRLLGLFTVEAVYDGPLARNRQRGIEARRQHVEQSDLGVEVFGDCRGSIGGVGRAFGEIDR